LVGVSQFFFRIFKCFLSNIYLTKQITDCSIYFYLFSDTKVGDNFTVYGLPVPEFVQADIFKSPVRDQYRFDAIVCDPPYGLRAQANTPTFPLHSGFTEGGKGGKGGGGEGRRVVGVRRNSKDKREKESPRESCHQTGGKRKRGDRGGDEGEREGEGAGEGGYAGQRGSFLSSTSEAIYRRLLGLAETHLRGGGKLVFWVPVPVAEVSGEEIDEEKGGEVLHMMQDYPTLRVAHRCRIEATNPKAEWERVLFTVNKIDEDGEGKEEEPTGEATHHNFVHSSGESSFVVEGEAGCGGGGGGSDKSVWEKEIERLLSLWDPRALSESLSSDSPSSSPSSFDLELGIPSAEQIEEERDEQIMRELTRKELYKATRTQLKGISTDIWRAAWKGMLFIYLFIFVCVSLMSIKGDTEAIKAYINAGGDVNVVERSKTPLFYASGYGKVASVQLLVENGAQVNALNGLGKFNKQRTRRRSSSPI